MKDLQDIQPERPFRRRVFYVPGYDPAPARRYRELYRREGTRQAEISGYRFDQKPLRTPSPKSWQARTIIDGRKAVARIDVLDWRDIVRGSMRGGIVATYLQLVRVAWLYLSTGTLRRLSWLRKGPVLAALYPVAVLLVQLLAALTVGWALGAPVSALTAANWGVPHTGWAIGLPIFVAIMRWFRRNDSRFFAYYLMQDFAFSAGRRGAYPKALEERISAFCDEVSAALASDVDEVLVVGHSSGAQIAASLVADLVRQDRVPDDGPKLGLLTLGQAIPMVSFLPKADRLRADLALLAEATEITWVDVSAPSDGCAFALCDPVAVTGVPVRDKRWPLVLSAAFTQTLSPERMARLRSRFYRLHFQYLCAFDRPGDYDYFAITAGPMTLRKRFHRRRSSRQRIDVPASRFVKAALEPPRRARPEPVRDPVS